MVLMNEVRKMLSKAA